LPVHCGAIGIAIGHRSSFGEAGRLSGKVSLDKASNEFSGVLWFGPVRSTAEREIIDPFVAERRAHLAAAEAGTEPEWETNDRDRGSTGRRP
jgi:hypothetical protein